MNVNLRFIVSAVVAMVACGQTGVALERLTVMEMMARQDDWNRWVREEETLQISGRYEGRVGRQLRLYRLPVLLTPQRTTVLPDNVGAGQRLLVTGILKRSGSRFVLTVIRVVPGSSDIERVIENAERLNDEHEKIYALAAEYDPVVEFYDDDDLRIELRSIRHKAFAAQRRKAKGDAAALFALSQRGRTLGINSSVLDAVLFESLIAQLRSKSVVHEKLAERIQDQLPGWDQQAELTPKENTQFITNPVETYDSADESFRRKLHRRLYRQALLPTFLKTVNPDGRNAQTVANRIAEKLPEETAVIADLRNQHIEYRLSRVPYLSRRQLQQLDSLLEESGRSADFPAALDQWLSAQEERLNNQELGGLLATAEQFQYAFEKWKHQKHGDRSIELLKKALAIAEELAPDEAVKIRQQLEQLGLIRIRDQWMTAAEVAALPRDDLAVAEREGRVVPGMNPKQVIEILGGEPSRRIRVVSRTTIEAIWIYEGSTAITVHLQHGRRAAADSAVVTLVGRVVQ